MSEYCRDDFGLVEQADDDFKMWQGLVGPHYTPSVSEDGTLSWSNNGQLPNPEDVSIKGPPGEPGPPGAPGPGVPAGGTTGQILAKASDEDYDGEWIDPPEIDAGQVSYDSTETYSDGTVGKELGTINSALSSLSSVTEIIDTASGAIASFPDGSGLPMRSLLAQINPVQDLHGQDAPYPAGGGKNKCSLESFSLEKPEERAKRIAIDTIPAGTYTISWVSNTTATTTMQIQDANNTSMVGNITITNSGSVTKTFTSDAAQIYAFISTSAEDGATATITNLQIEPGSTATPFAPYSNECPITNWTGLSGYKLNGNLFNGVFGTGETARVEIPTGATAFTATAESTSAKNLLMRFYDSIGTKVGSDVTLISGGTSRNIRSVTIPSGATLFSVYYQSGGSASEFSNVCVGIGDTFSVSWQSEAGTVYGGTVDVVTGVLTVDRVCKTVVGDLIADYRSFAGAVGFNVNSPQFADANFNKPILCNKLETIGPSQSQYYGACKWSGTSFYFWFQNGAFTDYADAVAKTNAEQLQCCYYLATPQTYQLTPQQILTLLGNNTVFVDCGEVSVTYQASIKGYIDKVLAS